MKHVLRLLVFLLVVNCTTDSNEVENTSENPIVVPEIQNCIDDLPKVKLTNNGTHSFDFLVYGQDYTLLYSQSISATADSGWVELAHNDVIFVARNSIVDGQKIQASLEPCDNLELEIDSSNTLVVFAD